MKITDHESDAQLIDRGGEPRLKVVLIILLLIAILLAVSPSARMLLGLLLLGGLWFGILGDSEASQIGLICLLSGGLIWNRYRQSKKRRIEKKE
ncbi:MAG: hypothetical protein ISN28_15435 [Ectothiorhodospiraceae bacterium AqS1]|nr:hypothetical protein [Ectothiorhodospiraceae bacterium AqS1]MBF2761624.1 hypothetical protein [Ectothiorhodospiraceae bacterium AqS1]